MMMINFLVILMFGVLVLVQSIESRPNVLFIMSEDLRPELPSYGNVGVIAPNLERLSKKSVSFDLTLSQVSICAPSRASMLTGLRPDKLGVYDFGHFGGLRFFRTIPSHLQSQGYRTAMSGKLFHWESSKHYTHFYYGQPVWEQVQREEMRFHNASVTPDSLHEKERAESEGGASFFRDAHITDHAISFLRQLNQKSPMDTDADADTDKEESDVKKPWFLGVGFKGTHLQYHMPERYWDAYSSHVFSLNKETGNTKQGEEVDSRYHSNLIYPKSAPLSGHVSSAESRYIMFMKNKSTEPGQEREAYQKDGKGKSISIRGWEELYRGYLASLSYMDAQLGRILDEVENLGLWENTIVVFTSDHGMHMGEKGMWAKWSLFDESTRVPLIIHDPTYPNSFGKRYEEPVELLDLFPTLVDMTNTTLDSKQCEMLRLRKPSGLEQSQQIQTLVKKEDMKRRAFQHQYCDVLDGISLTPILKAFSDQSKHSLNIHQKQFRSYPFAITQKLNCKSPGSMRNLKRTPPSSASAGFHGKQNTHLSGIDSRMIDPWTGPWIDQCPFKVSAVDRWPNYGVMGYSLRTRKWRYTAWILLDVNTLLPALDVKPLAEELYDHDTAATSADGNTNFFVVRSVTGRAELHNLAPNPVSWSYENTSANINNIHRSMRRDLYEFLYNNNSYQHVFQERAKEQVEMLFEVNAVVGDSSLLSPKEKIHRQKDFSNIVDNRFHVPHPHWSLYEGKGHYYNNERR